MNKNPPQFVASSRPRSSLLFDSSESILKTFQGGKSLVFVASAQEIRASCCG